MDQAAGWHADPAGRHEHRWWDGSAWTDHVADGGVAGVDPLPAADVAASVEQEAAALVARIEAAGLPEHPKLELSTAANVASGVLRVLACEPTAAPNFGISFPDDADGARLHAAAVLHQHRAELDLDGVTTALRLLAFHLLTVLPEDTASRQACARVYGEPDTLVAVATALGETYLAVVDPTPTEREQLHELFRTAPGAGAWDEAYHQRLHELLVTALLPGRDVPSTPDAAQLLWGVLAGILQPYALALFPDLAG